MADKKRREELITKLEQVAQLTNSEILARSLVSAVLFVLILTVLDRLQSKQTDMVQTASLGVIFAVILAIYDYLMRTGARSRLKKRK